MTNSDSVCFDKKEWFIETFFPGIRRCKMDAFRIDKELFKTKSEFQDVMVFESRGFGRILSIDGIIQFTQSDEFFYHETISHVPLMSHPDPKKFLIVGGGDGGALREAEKHNCLEELYLVDIDQTVIDVAKKYFPFVCKNAFKDKRFQLKIEDGRKFIKNHKNYFDVIIVDSTDPIGPGKFLFQGDFYKNVYEALTDDGFAIFQLGPFLDFNLIIKPTAKKLSKFFKYLAPVRLPMPSYSCGCEYCFLMASKKIDPKKIDLSTIEKRFKTRLGKNTESLKFYSPEIHKSILTMPKIWQL